MFPSIALCPQKLREHFLSCLHKGKFSDFPETVDSVDRNPGKMLGEEVFCRCRSVWLWYHGKQSNMRMAECEKCKGWFHQKCENISSNIFDKQNMKPWCCSSCTVN